MRDSAHIVILTGAGISAESGLSTFRDEGGLWCGHRVEDVATPEAYVRDPATVHAFYNARRAALRTALPNAAHRAVARLAAEWPGKVTLVTQNVDDLHTRAAKEMPPHEDFEFYAMHGELLSARCGESGEVRDWTGDLTTETRDPHSGKTGNLRPHIVWFGEMPLYMAEIGRALRDCDLFLSIGTSGNVYPAAGFVQQLRHYGRAHLVELNLEPSAGASYFDERITGKAGETVPAYVERILAGEIV